jgi:hypothetical protein
MNESNWMNEAVLPDESPLPSSSNKRYWSHEKGGCEGINHAEASLVNSTVIHRNKEKYQIYIDSFPFMGTDDRSRLLERASMIKSVVRSTKAWVQDFVLKYSLCPFAGESYFIDAH